MSKSNIPSGEDFARAKAAMAEDDRGLSEVRERILRRFHDRGVHEFAILYSRRADLFGAYVFYRLDREIGEQEQSGASAEIREAVYEELVAVGRGHRDSLKVNFEFDSHEQVQRNFAGNYLNRLR